MTDYDPDDNDVRDASITDTTRRGALAALALGGLAALGSGHATADLAGGPESDAMSEHRVPLYRVPENDLDSPGVVGRRVEITAGGSTYAAGDQLVDTGSSWERISAGVESLNTEKLFTESRQASVVVWEDGGTFYAGDSSSLVDSGADASSVLQSALDEAGSGRVEIGPGTYLGGGISPTDGVTIVGSGDSTVLQVDGSYSNFFSVFNPQHVSISDLHFDLNGTDGDGVNFTEPFRCEFQRLRFSNQGTGGVYLNLDDQDSNAMYGHGDLIANCEFRGAGGSCINLSGRREYQVIVGNRFFDSARGIIFTGGNCTIVGNRFTYCNTHGIYAKTGENDGKTVISGNTINHTDGDEPILLENVRLMNVTGNNIYAAQSHGIHLKGVFRCLIANNNIGNVGGSADNLSAIYITDDTEIADKNVITGNYAGSYKEADSNPGYGVREASGVSGNVVLGNVTTAPNGHALNSTNVANNFSL